MLRNDIIDHDKAKNTDITRNLKNATTRHYQNNPHMSMESAFAYIMSNSGIFRALPVGCIEEARRYLALPKTEDDAQAKFKQASSEGLDAIFDGLNQTLQHLSDNNLPLFLMPFRQVITVKERTPTQWNSDASPIDDLKEMFKEPIEPGTTVVHAERVIVDNRKMIKILKFENVVLRFDLPHEYFSSQPCCWKYKEGAELKYYDAPHTVHQNVLPGDILSLKDFGQMIKTMKEAGVRLSKINKTAKIEREHSGKFTVSI